MYGGPATRCLPVSRSGTELRFTVRTASPVIRTRSSLRKNATWPGVWPGVGTARQAGRPGTPAAGSNGTAMPSRLLRDTLARTAGRGISASSGAISHRSSGLPYCGTYRPAASGSSAGCT